MRPLAPAGLLVALTAGAACAPAPEAPPDGPSGLASLKSIMSVIRSPEFTGEATGQILGFARDNLPRGALFAAFGAVSVGSARSIVTTAGPNLGL